MSPTDQAIDTRSALLHCAAELMLERGWTGFSYADMAKAVGIRKASIHYHFPSKDDLGLALIQQWRMMYDHIHDQAESQFSDVPARLSYMIDFVCEHFGDRMICPAGALDADLMNLPEVMQNEVKTWSQQRLNRYARWLEAGRQQGSLQFDGSPEDQAVALLSGYQGALQMERVMDNQATRRFARQFMQGMQP